ncbi:hypothetical protein V8F06_005269 [Rhypophila decipiens]
MTVLCKETPRVTMVNEFPAGAKGLAASRWATPTKAAPQSKPATMTKRAGPTKAAAPTVLCKEVPRVTMENPLPKGAKGLAASRCATPAKPAPPTKPASSPSIKPAPAEPAPATARVLCQEVTKVSMVNPFPPGAKGLAASRWA